jgi:hypothetical protein
VWTELLAMEDGCLVCTCYEQSIHETASVQHSKKVQTDW